MKIVDMHTDSLPSLICDKCGNKNPYYMDCFPFNYSAVDSHSQTLKNYDNWKQLMKFRYSEKGYCYCDLDKEL